MPRARSTTPEIRWAINIARIDEQEVDDAGMSMPLLIVLHDHHATEDEAVTELSVLPSRLPGITSTGITVLHLDARTIEIEIQHGIRLKAWVEPIAASVVAALHCSARSKYIAHTLK